ncbi:hypothetical protein [Vibrio mediterranei]|uniref:Uncharacterized protein n=1 Tax=Vibrio mediterranei TaxID=689 RepID=A0A3G4V510_9VIBR|nr:hypothetical protein [Vibrio mediterranei]AYV19853.1 hypothetical protein ECB94_00455 [Vibrio mediterranei]
MELLVAFGALIIAAVTLYVQRVHNRHQMLPLLHISRDQTTKNGRVRITLSVINDGQGVAILKSMVFRVQDTDYEIKHNQELSDILETYLPKGATNQEVRYFHFIRANSRSLIISFEIPSDCEDPFSNSLLTIETESLYRDRVTVDNWGMNTTSNYADSVIEKFLSYFLPKTR